MIKKHNILYFAVILKLNIIIFIKLCLLRNYNVPLSVYRVKLLFLLQIGYN